VNHVQRAKTAQLDSYDEGADNLCKRMVTALTRLKSEKNNSVSNDERLGEKWESINFCKARVAQLASERNRNGAAIDTNIMIAIEMTSKGSNRRELPNTGRRSNAAAINKREAAEEQFPLNRLSRTISSTVPIGQLALPTE
jgi:hypothetical protein